jgi:putative FmdB family regulatory protein
MPMYSYRREDGTTFDYRQKFSDEPLKVDPETGQRVIRVVQASGIIFKGSGFYVNDSKGSSRTSLTSNSESNGAKAESNGNGSTSNETPKTEASTPKAESNGASTKTETSTTPTKTPVKAD